MDCTIQHAPDRNQLAALLRDCELPTDDLDSLELEHFLACHGSQGLRGVVGLEIYAPDALLRSLAVVPTARKTGCGSRLVESIEQHAARHGVESIYLLTETAVSFFAHHSYETIPRSEVADAIRHTAEFSALCPDDATLMRKRL